MNEVDYSGGGYKDERELTQDWADPEVSGMTIEDLGEGKWNIDGEILTGGNPYEGNTILTDSYGNKYRTVFDSENSIILVSENEA